jgi:hypothetical protein
LGALYCAALVAHGFTDKECEFAPPLVNPHLVVLSKRHHTPLVTYKECEFAPQLVNPHLVVLSKRHHTPLVSIASRVTPRLFKQRVMQICAKNTIEI